MDKIKSTRINLEPCAQCGDSSPYHLNDVGHARASQARLLTPISSIFAHPCPISNFSMEFSPMAHRQPTVETAGVNKKAAYQSTKTALRSLLCILTRNYAKKKYAFCGIISLILETKA